MRAGRTTWLGLFALAVLATSPVRIHAQAALLMEEPYGLFGIVVPTGHNAIYFDRVCAETPIKLRRCEPGELGAVIARYVGISGYDWMAIPLVPYLYSVEDASDVPARVNRETVERMRNRYYEAHLLDTLGANLSPGGFLPGGWGESLGAAYERRIYAFRFETTEAQDDALIARMNSATNHSQFDLLYSNCADFARVILNSYFPGTFRRSIFPDAGMTTPKQLAWKLEHYSRKHAEPNLAVFEIPQVPGYRHHSKSNKSVAESLSTTTYAIPIALLSPYIAGGLFLDYLVRGRHHLIPNHPQILTPESLSALSNLVLTTSVRYGQDAGSAVTQPNGAPDIGPAESPATEADLWAGKK
ncbi:MAG: hypothetical protein WBQ94_17205 [Terracidiphilus sp.]